MKKNGEYKDLALKSLSGKWGFAVIVTLIYMAIGDAPSVGINLIYSTQLGGLWTIVILPLIWGFFVVWLGLARGEKVDYGTMFDGFKDYMRIFLTTLLTTIYAVLWTLLLIVPGVIKSYSYSMTSYILKDNPDLKYDGAINESMRMMQGHKMEMFLLDLSFIGWYILCILTFGIGFLFLIPYWYTARAHFYEDLKELSVGAE